MTNGSMKFRARLAARLAAVLLLCGLSGVAGAWWQNDWPYRKQITIDGASLPGEVANVPVLVRLHEGVFRFPDAKPDGTDIRFVTDDDKTPLKFHIEKYDSVFNMAQIWVQVPKVSPKQPVHIWMYYGNTKATPSTDASAATFDAGQVLVYHFGERGTPPADASGHGLNATTPSAVVDAGLIGADAKFDGSSAVALPASPVLSFLPTSPLTIGFWIKPVAADAAAIIYAQRDPSGAALVVGMNAGVPYVSVADAGSAARTSSPTMPIADGNWHRIDVVAAQAQIQLFVDGQSRSFLARGLPALSGAASLGGDGGVGGRPVMTGFRGELDEFGIANVARDPAWLALQAANQGTADKLVQFGPDEQQSSLSSGYVGIILGSVTLDGWVVICVLLVMMAVSWYVMGSKGRQIGRVGKANAAFLAAFRQSGGDLVRLHRALMPEAKGNDLGIDDAARATIQSSPVLKMFNEGLHELQQRLGKERKPGRPVVLSEQSIEAIRASINTVFVREQQALNKLMVMLTIAISGGPFVGLLGTVVGVMITFAAVAAAGDVNVNAIAPGISAALVATVFGLFVAIPALFGYNYLLTRIKECGVEMQVFVDVFVARLAENYNDESALHAMADE